MNLRRRTVLALLALSPLPGFAQPRVPEVGLHYHELRPIQPVEGGGKIEVLEFFWYGCPHCYTLQPALEKWVARLAGDVRYRRVPAVFNDNWARDAAVFYAFEALGVLERLHRPYFDAIHRDGLKTRDAAALNAWLRKNGVDAKRYEEAYKSFGVQSKVRRATQVTVAYRIDGTPALAVQGRFTIPNQTGIFATADYLIDLVRRGG